MIDSNKWFNEAKELEKQLEDVKTQLAAAEDLIAKISTLKGLGAIQIKKAAKAYHENKPVNSTVS